jgi:hypothetical protein
MTTWNESAKDKLIVLDYSCNRTAHDSELKIIMCQLIQTVEQKHPDMEILLYSTLKNLGLTATRLLEQLGLWDPQTMLDLLVRKQRDYGHGNIQAFGVMGVAVRVCDKIARYYNLVDDPMAAENEPFVDCLFDMVGYSVISSMLDDHTFKLELGATV